MHIDTFVGGIRRFAGSLSRILAMSGLGGHGGRLDRRRRREIVQLIRTSSLFDELWYLQTYMDVASARVDPATHFAETGWREGRDPGPDFATSAYLKANPDVARAGINPLVHYIEFGKFEGREMTVRRTRERPVAVQTQKFARPAPVFKGEISESGATAWKRSYRLSPDSESVIRAGDLSLGIVGDPLARQSIETEVAVLRRISGFEPRSPERAAAAIGAADCKIALVDAWHAGGGLLRTRWQVTGPIIIRAYQHDPVHDGQIALVGETLAETSLDFVDSHLTDPLVPLLFVFADPQNLILATALLAFPSLCRGGIHYAELVAASGKGGDEPPDPLAAGLDLAAALDRLKIEDAGRIRNIEIEDSGGDGSGPLFQPQFRNWLRRVFGVRISPLDHGADTIAETSGSRSEGSSFLRSNGGTLILAPDMLPTIGVLAAMASGEAGQPHEVTFAPLLSAAPDPSQPVLLAEIPADMTQKIVAADTGYPTAWPRVAAAAIAPDREYPAAIRFTDRHGPSDSELLFPTTIPAVGRDDPADEGIAWLIRSDEWTGKELSEGLKALSLQSGAGECEIVSIGQPSAEAQAALERLFRGRVRSYRDLASAAGALQERIVGHLGPGVILHDSRTTRLLVGFLQEPSVSSVSCVLVTAEKEGKTSHVAVADAGQFDSAGPRGAPTDSIQLARHLWRSTYPVRRPPRDLWLARSNEVKSWLGGKGGRTDAVHLCTALVTASYSRRQSENHADSAPPPTQEEVSLRTRLFFG